MKVTDGIMRKVLPARARDRWFKTPREQSIYADKAAYMVGKNDLPISKSPTQTTVSMTRGAPIRVRIVILCWLIPAIRNKSKFILSMISMYITLPSRKCMA